MIEWDGRRSLFLHMGLFFWLLSHFFNSHPSVHYFTQWTVRLLCFKTGQRTQRRIFACESMLFVLESIASSDSVTEVMYTCVCWSRCKLLLKMTDTLMMIMHTHYNTQANTLTDFHCGYILFHNVLALRGAITAFSRTWQCSLLAKWLLNCLVSLPMKLQPIHWW